MRHIRLCEQELLDIERKVEADAGTSDFWWRKTEYMSLQAKDVRALIAEVRASWAQIPPQQPISEAEAMAQSTGTDKESTGASEPVEAQGK